MLLFIHSVSIREALPDTFHSGVSSPTGNFLPSLPQKRDESIAPSSESWKKSFEELRHHKG
jgi:hypothetical protein